MKNDYITGYSDHTEFNLKRRLEQEGEKKMWPGAIPKTIEAYGTEPYKLTVVFESGDKKVLDIEKYIEKDEELKILKERPELFSQVQVSDCGYMVYWDTGNGYVWFHCDHVFMRGEPVTENIETDGMQIL